MHTHFLSQSLSHALSYTFNISHEIPHMLSLRPPPHSRISHAHPHCCGISHTLSFTRFLSDSLSNRRMKATAHKHFVSFDCHALTTSPHSHTLSHFLSPLSYTLSHSHMLIQHSTNFLSSTQADTVFLSLTHTPLKISHSHNLMFTRTHSHTLHNGTHTDSSH